MESSLGIGIFTAPDISEILQLPTYKVRRWIKAYWDNCFAIQQNETYSWGAGKEKAVDFNTFIEIYIFVKLRELGLSPKKILTAHKLISEEFQIKFPFAFTKILAGEKDIFYYFDKDVVIKADITKQLGFKNLIELYYKKIDFSFDNLAERYWPLGKGHSIVVDPKHQFGAPTIDGTNILTNTIYGFYKGGESIDFIASIYNINVQQVKDAIYYYQRKAA
ncbi:MAG: hypothetical protein HW421_1375 [Ignavibacteria bacterium]|nr:hypothetical protein [Ignavibacteria bacterium]